MKVSRLFTVAAAVLGMLVLAPIGAQAGTVLDGPAVTDTPLQMVGLGDIAVDDAHHHVFLTGGLGGAKVFVLNFRGQVVTSIGHEPGANGLLLDEAHGVLYVALNRKSAISVIDLTTLVETHRIRMPTTDPGPSSLAFAGGRIWFGFGNPDSYGGIGSLNPATGKVTTYRNDAGPYPFYDPVVASSPAAPNMLVAADRGLHPVEVRAYDVSTGTPTLVGDHWDLDAGELGELLVTPDGSGVLVADGYNTTGVQRLSLPSLDPAGLYPTPAGPDAAAVTADGSHVAAGLVDRDRGPDVAVSAALGSNPISAFSLGGAQEPIGEGMAFDASASRLFVVTRRPWPGAASVFHVVHDPTKADATISFDPTPTSAPAGTYLDVSGRLDTGDDAALVGASLDFQFFDAQGHREYGGYANVDASGVWTGSLNVPTTRGTRTLTAYYRGDAGRHPATASVVIDVLGGFTTLTMSASSATAPPGGGVTLSGHLDRGGSAQPVEIYAEPHGGSQTLLGTAPLSPEGDYSFTASNLNVNTTFHAIWPGDETYEPASSPPVDVTVKTTLQGGLTDYGSVDGDTFRYGFNPQCGIDRHTGCPQFVVARTPATPYWDACIVVQEQTASGWTTRPGWPVCGNTSYDGLLAISMYTGDSTLIGVPLRVRGVFAGDSVNTGDRTPWFSFELTNDAAGTQYEHYDLEGQI
jgi:hypothetical protein